MISARFKIGEQLVVEVERESLDELIPVCGFLGEVQAKCQGRKNVQFFYRSPKGFEYFGIVDLDTREELKFGQLKEPKGAFFLRQDAQFEPPFGGQGGANQERAEGPGHYDQGEPGQGEGEPASDEVPMNYPPPQPAAQTQQRRDYAVPATRPSQGLPRPPQQTSAPAGRPRRF